MPPHVAIVLAFLVVAVETSLVDAFLLPGSAGRRGVRVMHFVFASLQLVACGALMGLGIAGWQRARERVRLPAFPLVLAAALAIAALTLPDDVGGVADRISSTHSRTVLPVLIVGVAVIQAAFVALLGRLSRSRFGNVVRVLAALAGVSVAAANPIVLAHDYPGVHLALALMAGVAIAHGVAGLPAGRLDRLPARIAIALAAALSAFLVVRPPNAVLADMLRATGAVVAPFASRFRTHVKRDANIPPAIRPWFEKRQGTLPARPRVLPHDGVVVLLTVDALRADVIMSGKHDAQIPNLAAMRDEGVRFTQARSPGAQTVPVVTGIFTGKYYTQVYWSGGTAKHGWSADDDSVRFPELLQQAGVTTVTMPTLPEVQSVHGTVRGFTEDKAAWKRVPREPSPFAEAVATKIKRRLDRAGAEGGPLFLYAHFADAHAPYTRGGTDCAPFACYVREVAMIDAAIGQIREVLQGSAFSSRSVLIVSADHGEAFGEHGQRYHATTLYDELLRVPLLMTGPGFAARAVDTPVTLLDLGPTILEMYGLPVPAAFMGQSLVRLLRNEPDTLTRPIAADSGRLMQALVFADNIKIVRSNRNHTVEMYDLNRDPGEERSIFESAPDAEDRLAVIDALFDANAFKKPGYTAPYRK